jgi:hypothetical protein
MPSILPEVLIVRQVLAQGANFDGTVPGGSGFRDPQNTSILTYEGVTAGGVFFFNPDTIYRLLRVALFVGSSTTWSVALKYNFLQQEVVLADQASDPILTPAGVLVLDLDLVMAPGDVIVVRTDGAGPTEQLRGEVCVAREQVLSS